MTPQEKLAALPGKWRKTGALLIESQRVAYESCADELTTLLSEHGGGGGAEPAGHHHVYKDPFGSGSEVIVHNNGGEWNGQKPLRSIPYYYTTPPTPSAPANFVPGVMACAKCKFRLVRTNLYVRSGTTGPGDNATEPCPNGCGPLWPVSWEQEARECWKLLEEMATPPSAPVVDDAMVERYLLAECQAINGEDSEYQTTTERDREIVRSALTAALTPAATPRGEESAPVVQMNNAPQIVPAASDEEVPSRSRLRRIAAERGEPAPRFDASEDGLLRWLDAQCADADANPRFAELRELIRRLATPEQPGSAGEDDSIEWGGCTCQDCGVRYYADLLVPDEVWARVNNGHSLLCAACIMERIVALGIWSAARAVDVDTPPPAPATTDRIEAMRDALGKAAKAVSGPEAPMPTVPELAARLSQEAAPAAEQPEGKWKLVPVEATPEMLAAYTALDYSDLIEFNYYGGMTGWDLTVTDEGGKNAWNAMLAAAPAAPVGVDETFAAIMAEIERATRKFPTWPTDPLHAVAVVNEEVGELNKALLQAVYEPHKSTHEDVATEAIQAAAMTYRFAASLVRYNYARCEQHEQPAHAAAPTQEKAGG